MSVLPFSVLIVPETKETIYAKGLQVGAFVGLPVSTWTAGDPTRSDYWYCAEILSTTELKVEGLARSAFLTTSSGDWLRVKAYEDFNVEAADGTRGVCTCRLTNTGGGRYAGIEPGDLTAECTATGKTYTNTTGGDLIGVGATLDLEFVADEVGSDSNAAVGEIDSLVTVLPKVTISNTTACVANDDEDEDSIKERCRDKLGALSPNGPRDAYASVARDFKLTGTAGVTDVKVYDDSDTGDVTVYLRGPSGAVSSDDRAAVEAAILKYAVPLCITCEVLSATNKVVAVTYELWLYASDAREEDEIKAAVEDALEAMFAKRPIGGDIVPPGTAGALYLSLIEATIRGVSTRSFRVEVTLPASETTSVDPDEVLVLGAVTGTITKADDP